MRLKRVRIPIESDKNFLHLCHRECWNAYEHTSSLLHQNQELNVLTQGNAMETRTELQKSIKYLTEVEELAQDILTDKETKLQLSNTQNKFREAYRALQQTTDRQTWLKVGTVYVQFPTEECKGIVKEELDKVTLDIENLYEGIKNKVGKLRDLEHQPGIEGFRLKPMTGAEAKAIHKAFGVN